MMQRVFFSCVYPDRAYPALAGRIFEPATKKAELHLHDLDDVMLGSPAIFIKQRLI